MPLKSFHMLFLIIHNVFGILDSNLCTGIISTKKKKRTSIKALKVLNDQRPQVLPLDKIFTFVLLVSIIR
ncbi:hypothetical protein C6W20_04645 [Bacillus sp. NMCN6]|nr:hypothetical protein C6W20_04645 [Bacillus sp. NMCN6]